jgi:hypothetical protein
MPPGSDFVALALLPTDGAASPNAQWSGLAGHASLSAHQRNLATASKLQRLPEAAFPQLQGLPAFCPRCGRIPRIGQRE